MSRAERNQPPTYNQIISNGWKLNEWLVSNCIGVGWGASDCYVDRIEAQPVAAAVGYSDVTGCLHSMRHRPVTGCPPSVCSRRCSASCSSCWPGCSMRCWSLAGFGCLPWTNLGWLVGLVVPGHSSWGLVDCKVLPGWGDNTWDRSKESEF